MKQALMGLAIGCLLLSGVSPAAAVSLEQFTLYGFFDIEYEKADGPGNTDPTLAVGDENGSFDQYHFNLIMGFPVSDRVAVSTHVEFEHGPQLPDQGELNFEWAYVNYLVNNYLTLRAGMVLTPFGLYNEIHDATPTFQSVRIPWEIYKTKAVGGVAMFPKMSTGLIALGRYESPGLPVVDYTAYVGNGENFSKNEAEKDENPDKAIGARVMLSPMQGVTVGGSYYQGEKQTSPTTASDHIAWVGSLDLNLRGLALRSEYASSDVSDVTQRGWYAEAGYTVDMVTPYARFGAFDPNTTVGSDEWANAVYGINVRLQSGVVLKAEWRHVAGESGNADVNLGYNEIAGSLSVAF